MNIDKRTALLNIFRCLRYCIIPAVLLLILSAETTSAAPPRYRSAFGQKSKNIENPQAEKTENKRSFYGIEVDDNKRSLFIIDTSKSMSSQSHGKKGKTKLDVLKNEIKKLFAHNLAGSTPSGGYGFIFFSSKVVRFPPKGLAGYTNKSMPKITASGQTKMLEAWEAAAAVIKTEKIDTVYFMTDGNPSDGFRIKWLKNNLDPKKYPQLVINCICIGKNRKMMQNIAKLYHGKYVCIE